VGEMAHDRAACLDDRTGRLDFANTFGKKNAQ
jgi:hypothetical protein